MKKKKLNETNIKKAIEDLKDFMFNKGALSKEIQFFNYDYESVVKLEDFIKQYYPEEVAKDTKAMKITLGFLFGEAIVKSIPGWKWNFDTKDIWDIQIVCKSKQASISPIWSVSNFMYDNNKHLYNMFLLCKDQVEMSTEEFRHKYKLAAIN